MPTTSEFDTEHFIEGLVNVQRKEWNNELEKQQKITGKLKSQYIIVSTL